MQKSQLDFHDKYKMVPRSRIELLTPGSSDLRSTTELPRRKGFLMSCLATDMPKRDKFN